jgi:hypothetical protein
MTTPMTTGTTSTSAVVAMLRLSRIASIALVSNAMLASAATVPSTIRFRPAIMTRPRNIRSTSPVSSASVYRQAGQPPMDRAANERTTPVTATRSCGRISPIVVTICRGPVDVTAGRSS